MGTPLEGEIGRSFKFEGKEYWYKEPEPRPDHIHVDFELDKLNFLRHHFFAPIIVEPNSKITSTNG